MTSSIRRSAPFARALPVGAFGFLLAIPVGDIPASAGTKSTKSAVAPTKSGAGAPKKSVRTSKTTTTRKLRAQRFPDVTAIEVVERAVNTFDVTVTMSSPYDTPQRYADAWRVLDERGTVLGIREILHDHATEQPFTRSLEGVIIPAQVKVITVEGRDQTYGWGGKTKSFAVMRSK
jgi:hypothetical protein